MSYSILQEVRTIHYDKVIVKLGDNTGSLRDFKIDYNEVVLRPNGVINYEGIKNALTNRTKVIGIPNVLKSMKTAHHLRFNK